MCGATCSKALPAAKALTCTSGPLHDILPKLQQQRQQQAQAKDSAMAVSEQYATRPGSIETSTGCLTTGSETLPSVHLEGISSSAGHCVLPCGGHTILAQQPGAVGYICAEVLLCIMRDGLHWLLKYFLTSPPVFTELPHATRIIRSWSQRCWHGQAAGCGSRR